jgi:hypothetical protein
MCIKENKIEMEIQGKHKKVKSDKFLKNEVIEN